MPILRPIRTRLTSLRLGVTLAPCAHRRPSFVAVTRVGSPTPLFLASFALPFLVPLVGEVGVLGAEFSLSHIRRLMASSNNS